MVAKPSPQIWSAAIQLYGTDAMPHIMAYTLWYMLFSGYFHCTLWCNMLLIIQGWTVGILCLTDLLPQISNKISCCSCLSDTLFMTFFQLITFLPLDFYASVVLFTGCISLSQMYTHTLLQDAKIWLGREMMQEVTEFKYVLGDSAL